MRANGQLVRTVIACVVLAVSAAALTRAAAPSFITEALSQSSVPPAELHREIIDHLVPLASKLQRPATAADWQREADRLRGRILQDVILRGVPANWTDRKLAVEESGTVSTKFGYTIHKIRYEALPGLWIPALVYQPDQAPMPGPAVLHFEGHVGPQGKAIGYKQTLSHRLALRGYVVMSPDWPGIGEMTGEAYMHNRLSQLDLLGTSGVSVFYLTAKRALDYLSELHTVDPKQIAVTGLSGGGWQTILLSALDTRVAVSIPVAGFIGFEARLQDQGSIGDLEQNPSDLHGLADYRHLAAMLAPRPALFMYNANDECCFRPPNRAMASVFEPIRPFYELFGKSGSFRLHVNQKPGTHNYERDNQDNAIEFLSEFLPVQHDYAKDADLAEDAVLSEAQLRVDLPKENATFRSLALELLQRNPLPSGRVPDRKRVADFVLMPKLRFSANATRSDRRQTFTVRQVKFQGEGWSVPAVDFQPTEGDKTPPTTIVLCDKGRKEAADTVANLLPRSRVIVAEPILLSELSPPQFDRAQYAMIISTVGLRPIGIQAAQLLALIDEIKSERGVRDVRVETIGERSSMAALVALAASPRAATRLTVHDLRKSLRSLIDDNVFYNDEPELFSFGLLRAFDIDELVELAKPAIVEWR